MQSGSRHYSGTHSPDVEDVGGVAPLLVNDSAVMYNTTTVKMCDHKKNVENLSDDEDYCSDESFELLEDMGYIGDILLQAKVMKNEVDEKLLPWVDAKFRPGILKILIAFFTLLGVASIVGCILWTLNVFPMLHKILELAVLSIAIGGNSLGSWTLYYTSAFRSEISELTERIKRLENADDRLMGYVGLIMRHRYILDKSSGRLKKEVGQLSKQIDRFKRNDINIRGTTENLKDRQGLLKEENDQMAIEKEELRNTEKAYTKYAKDLQDDQKEINSYNENAEKRKKQLSWMLETIKPSNYKLEDQVNRFEEVHRDVELESNRINRRLDRTTKDVDRIFDAIREITKRQERVMLYQLMERILMAGKSQDVMDLEGFKKFIAQIPKGLQRGDFQKVWERWFEETKGRAPGVEQTKIKEMIDEITQDKVNRQQRAFASM